MQKYLFFYLPFWLLSAFGLHSYERQHLAKTLLSGLAVQELVLSK